MLWLALSHGQGDKSKIQSNFINVYVTCIAPRYFFYKVNVQREIEDFLTILLVSSNRAEYLSSRY